MVIKKVKQSQAESLAQIGEAAAPPPGARKAPDYDTTIGGFPIFDRSAGRPEQGLNGQSRPAFEEEDDFPVIDDAPDGPETSDCRRSDVGYRRPPKETQFQPGRSGNPSGRPRHREGFQTLMTRTLQSKRRVKTENGVEELTLEQLIAMQLCQRAGTGDIRAFDRVKPYLKEKDEPLLPKRGGRIVSFEMTQEEIDRIEGIKNEFGPYFEGHYKIEDEGGGTGSGEG